MNEEVDILIIGGGMASLSLARELIQQKITEQYRIVILESRLGYSKDKVWSFWNVDDENYSDIMIKQWERFEVIDTKKLLTESKYPYLSIDSGNFYTQVLSLIQQDNNISLLTSQEVLEIREENDRRIVTTNTSEFKTKYIFDSRPPDYDLGKEGLYQHFMGWHIQTEEELFNPGIATIMDFTCDQTNGIHFFYVLPYAKNEALIEATWFAPTILTKNDYNLDMDLYLTDKYGMINYDLIYEELGIIPMVMNIEGKSRDPQIINIGTRGGHTRPSTGYTFLSSQQFARQMAANLGEGRFKPPKMRSIWTLYLDKVFLRVLRDYPQIGPELFLSLFERNPHDLVIRFLSDRSNFIEDLKIMISVPHKLKFVRSAILSLIRL